MCWHVSWHYSLLLFWNISKGVADGNGSGVEGRREKFHQEGTTVITNKTLTILKTTINTTKKTLKRVRQTLNQILQTTTRQFWWFQILMILYPWGTKIMAAADMDSSSGSRESYLSGYNMESIDTILAAAMAGIEITKRSNMKMATI